MAICSFTWALSHSNQSGIWENSVSPVLAEKGIDFTFDNDVCVNLAKRAHENSVRGARDLRRLVRKDVEDKIAEMLVERQDEQITKIKVIIEDEKVTVIGL